MSQNYISDTGVEALAKLTNLTHLDLSKSEYSDNRISESGTKALAKLTNLTHLNLDWNDVTGFDNEGTRALTELTGLTHLKISSNKLGADGAHALTKLTGLTHLGLRNNNIGDKGILTLLQTLTSNENQLKYLDIQSNRCRKVDIPGIKNPDDPHTIFAAFRLLYPDSKE